MIAEFGLGLLYLHDILISHNEGLGIIYHCTSSQGTGSGP